MICSHGVVKHIGFPLFIWEKLISFSDSFVLTGLIEAAAVEYSGIQIEELSLDEKAEVLFLDQGYETSLRHVLLYHGFIGSILTYSPLLVIVYLHRF